MCRCARVVIGYIVGAVLLAAGFVAVVATAINFSLSSILGIWLGALFSPFFLVGLTMCLLNVSNEKIKTCMLFFGAIILIILTYGLTAGLLFTGPWYYMKMLGVGTNVQASGQDAQKFGTYHFNETAFVDSRYVGVKMFESSSKNKKNYRFYCVAPIVGSLQQGHALYWAVAYDCCTLSPRTQSCWPVPSYNKTSPSPVVISKPALACTIGLESDNSLYLSSRITIDALQDALTTFAGQIRVDVPPGVTVDPSVQVNVDKGIPLWVSLRKDNPETFRDRQGDIGVISMALTVVFWPLALSILITLFVLMFVRANNREFSISGLFCWCCCDTKGEYYGDCCNTNECTELFRPSRASAFANNSASTLDTSVSTPEEESRDLFYVMAVSSETQSEKTPNQKSVFKKNKQKDHHGHNHVDSSAASILSQIDSLQSRLEDNETHSDHSLPPVINHTPHSEAESRLPSVISPPTNHGVGSSVVTIESAYQYQMSEPTMAPMIPTSDHSHQYHMHEDSHLPAVIIQSSSTSEYSSSSLYTPTGQSQFEPITATSAPSSAYTSSVPSYSSTSCASTSSSSYATTSYTTSSFQPVSFQSPPAFDGSINSNLLSSSNLSSSSSSTSSEFGSSSSSFM